MRSTRKRILDVFGETSSLSLRTVVPAVAGKLGDMVIQTTRDVPQSLIKDQVLVRDQINDGVSYLSSAVSAGIAANELIQFLMLIPSVWPILNAKERTVILIVAALSLVAFMYAASVVGDHRHTEASGYVVTTGIALVGGTNVYMRDRKNTAQPADYDAVYQDRFPYAITDDRSVLSRCLSAIFCCKPKTAQERYEERVRNEDELYQRL